MVGHLLRIFPRVGLLGLQVCLLPIFWRTFRLVSRIIAPACNPTEDISEKFSEKYLLIWVLTLLAVICKYSTFVSCSINGYSCSAFHFLSFPLWSHFGGVLSIKILQIKLQKYTFPFLRNFKFGIDSCWTASCQRLLEEIWTLTSFNSLNHIMAQIWLLQASTMEGLTVMATHLCCWFLHHTLTSPVISMLIN